MVFISLQHYPYLGSKSNPAFPVSYGLELT